MLRKSAEYALVSPLQFLLNNLTFNHNLSDALQRKIAEECAAFIMTNARSALQFRNREGLWDLSLSRMLPKGLALEFGVLKGYSINYFAKVRPSLVFHGFDSFEGLHVDWAGTSSQKGTFDQGGKFPSVRSNVKLIKGWFNDTVPHFLEENPGPAAFIHIDCDTYDAASICLKLLRDRIVVGTVIVFDDYFGYRGWLLGEHKAWIEFVTENKVEFEYLGFTNERMSLVIKDIGARVS
jgi:hypothetical protein